MNDPKAMLIIRGFSNEYVEIRVKYAELEWLNLSKNKRNNSSFAVIFFK